MPETEALGDCLLHGDHHLMTPECWYTVIDFYMNTSDEAPGVTGERAVRLYKAAYERALLNAIRTEEANA